MLGPSPQGQWRPIIEGSDAPRFAKLAAAMPDACRGLTLIGEDGAVGEPEKPAASLLLTDFLSVMVDHLVRSTKQIDALVAGAPKRAAAMRSSVRSSSSSIHDRWRESLTSATGALIGSPDEVAKLIQEVKEWQRPIALTTSAPFRLTFRLDEPD